MAVPSTLQNRNQWLIWKFGSDKRKLPINQWGKVSGSNREADYLSYADALKASRVNHGIEGLAWCFTPDDGMFGLDIDDCINTEHKPKPWVVPILRRLYESRTYAEISPSGTGIKAWFLGSYSASPTKASVGDGLIELFGAKSCQFFCFTGAKIPQAGDDVTDGTTFAAWLIETYFPKKSATHHHVRPVTVDDPLDAAMARYVAGSDAPPAGQRNSAAFRLAGHLRAMEYRGQVPTEQDVTRHVKQWNACLPEPLEQSELEECIRNSKEHGTPPAPKIVDGPNGRVVPTTTNGEALGWPMPKPLSVARNEVLPYDSSMLPSCVRLWIDDITDRMQCPPDFPAVATVVVMSGIIGNRFAVRVKQSDNWSVIPNLWGCVIGRPGIMKSPSMEEAIAMVDRLEREESDRCASHMAEWRAEEYRRKARIKHLTSQLERAVRNGDDAEIDSISAELGEIDTAEVSAPKGRRYVAGDATSQALAVLMSENPSGLIVYRDELSGLIESMKTEGQEGATSFYLETWSGKGKVVQDRVGRGRIVVRYATLAILGSIQPARLGPLIKQARETGGDGLIQRFQLAVWPDIDRNFRDVDREPDFLAEQLAWEMFKRLASVTPEQMGLPSHSYRPPYLRLSFEAQEAADDWRRDLELRIREPDLPEVLQSHYSKLKSVFASLCLIFHLADGEPGPIGKPAVDLALRWMPYLESHARRLYRTPLEEESTQAETILDRIRGGQLRSGFTLKDIYRPQRDGIKTKKDAESAAEHLEEMGWIRRQPEIVRRPGRPILRYDVHPSLEKK